MGYEIEQTIAFYKSNKLERLLVLWRDGAKYVRATYAETKPRAGYFHLKQNEAITDELIQKVAGAGMYANDELKKRFINYENLKFSK